MSSSPENQDKGQEEEEEEDGGVDVGLLDNRRTAGGALLLLFLFLSFGAYFISYYENITFFNAFYFCFVTMTTIGFGDIVPGEKAGCYEETVMNPVQTWLVETSPATCWW